MLTLGSGAFVVGHGVRSYDAVKVYLVVVRRSALVVAMRFVRQILEDLILILRVISKNFCIQFETETKYFYKAQDAHSCEKAKSSSKDCNLFTDCDSLYSC